MGNTIPKKIGKYCQKLYYQWSKAELEEMAMDMVMKWNKNQSRWSVGICGTLS